MDGNDALLNEAQALSAAARDRGLQLLLMGGMAVRALCPTSRSAPFARNCSDLDYFSKGPAAAIEKLFASRQWLPETEFNLYNGSSRLKFRSPPELGKSADIFVGSFRMCHRIALGRGDARGAIGLPREGAEGHAPPLTLPLAELLLTKLQVVEANDKDFADLFCLLADHAPGSAAEGMIDVSDFVSPCAEDWGLQTTIERSLATLLVWIRTQSVDEDLAHRVLQRVEALRDALHESPKSIGWKARALVGTRARWYELPEEVE